MGQKLMAYYDEASKIGGLAARVEMSLITKLSREKAKAAPDSAENLKLFAKALEVVKLTPRK